jgi:hypothetical protein
MKRILLTLTFLLAMSGGASAQFAPGTENLSGLRGVRLIVMFAGPTRAEAFDEVKRPGVLRMLEDDTKAKLQEAGIPFSGSRLADDRLAYEIGNAGNPRLIVLAKFDEANSFEIEAKLLQTVRLTRDPSIVFDAVTWSLGGGGNTQEIPMIRHAIADVIDSFIRDYLSVNPKQPVSSGKDESRDTKH